MHLLFKRLVFVFIVFATLTNTLKAQNNCVSNPVLVHGALSVSGTKIVDQNNQTVSFAGNSLFWSNTGFGAEKYYNSNVVSWLQQDWGTTIVRAAMGVDEFGGYLSRPQENQQRVETIVDAAIANDMYVIIDWHSHHAENYRAQSINFFQQMARKYGDHPNVIYEIYNEPINSSWSQAIKPYAEAVIKAIRAIDPDNLIVVGTPFFSQEVDVASRDPIRGYSNIAYTLHFYAGTHGESLRQRAMTAIGNGIALMVTEWGTVNANGDGSVNQASTEQWMDFLWDNDISHLNWSIHDKAEGASALRPGTSPNGGWTDRDLTASGLTVRRIIENWHQCDDLQVASNQQPNNNSNQAPDEVALAIPGTIHPTDFDTGGFGVSYFDTDEGNNGNGPRQRESVDTEFRTEGGNIGWIEDGEWLEFTVNVQTTGRYRVTFDVAARRDVGSSLHLEFDRQNVTGDVSVPSTGRWSSFTTVVSQGVQLQSGEQKMRVFFDRGGFNLADVSFQLTSEVDNNVVADEPVPATPMDTSPMTEVDVLTPDPVVDMVDAEDVSNPADEFDCIPVRMPFAQDGVGMFCWEASGTVNFVNSWNLDSLKINGEDFTNMYSSSLPDPINGKYFIEYECSVPWGHFEINGTDQ